MGIRDIQIATNNSVENSQNFLCGKHNIINNIETVESLVLDEVILTDSDRKAIEYHLRVIRSHIAEHLWKNGFFISVTIIDEFVLAAVKDKSSNICSKVIQELDDRGANGSGFVLYPLINFGMELPRIFSSSKSNDEGIIVFKKAGFCVSKQINSLHAIKPVIKQMINKLAIGFDLDEELLEHHIKVGGMAWAHRNPLMMIKLKSHTGDYFENQFIYTLKIRLSSCLLAIVYSIQNRIAETNQFMFSSSVNNYQTLDIRHYIVGESTDSSTPTTNLLRIPMNLRATELTKLTDLSLNICVQEMNLKKNKLIIARAINALKVIEMNYVAFVNLPTKSRHVKRFFNRIMLSIEWYRMSFSVKNNLSDSIICLAVAFETLLTYSYQPGQTKFTSDRLSKVLKGLKGKGKMIASVKDLFDARGEAVHNGATFKQFDIRDAQKAFSWCLIVIGELIDKSLKSSVKDHDLIAYLLKNR